MTASVFLIVAVALVALVSGICFVGCVLDTHGTGREPDPKPFTDYSDSDILQNANCIAYWPLNDSVGQTTAVDRAGKMKGDPHNGQYRSKVNFGSLFPCPDYQVDPGGPVDSAYAPGDITLQAAGIVPGDTNNSDPNDPTPAISVDGGFVFVDFNSVINPPDPFTVEFWAKPAWTSGSKAAYRTVIDSRNQTGGQFFGFAVFVNEQGNWEGQLGGTGSGNYAAVPGPKADLTKASYVVMRASNKKASIFVDGVASPEVSLPMGSSFAPNNVKPLVIGVGAAYLADRTSPDPSEYNRFPLLPFNGTIQCVALYNGALSDDDITKHFDHGSGKPDPAG